MRPSQASPVPSNSPRPPTAVGSSNGSTATPNGTYSGASTSLNECTQCRLIHPASRKCPSLKSEIQIRIALDDVKGLSGGDSVVMQRNKSLLQSLLKEKIGTKLQLKGNESPQPQPPVPALQLPQEQVPRQPARQLVQQPEQQQIQISAPAESSESASSSESESELASEAGPGSSGSDSGEDVLREILSR